MRTTSRFGGWSLDGDRRANSRVPLRAPVLVDSISVYQSCRCRDVSAGGASMVLERPLPVGTRVELYFELPTGVAIETEAEVVRADGCRVAVQFVGLDALSRRALIAYCEMSGVRRIRLPQPATG